MDLRICPEIRNDELNTLFFSAWSNHKETDFSYLSTKSLGYICSYQENKLVGFVNIAWDGSKHAFLLDTTIGKEHQRKGIGRKLVQEAIKYVGQRGIEWLHVDFEPELEPFYLSCGFQSSKAGVYRMTPKA